MKYKGTFRSQIMLGASSDSIPSRIHVLPKGEFMTMPYGNMVIDDVVMDQMIMNFANGPRRELEIDIDHGMTGEGTRAAGWIKGLVKEEAGLYADVEWTPFGSERVKNKEYRMISPEWSFDYVDPEKSTHHGAALLAAALTNRPLFKSLDTITASELKKSGSLTSKDEIVILFADTNSIEENAMDKLQEILAKAPEDRTAEDLAYLQANEADLTDEMKAQIATETESEDDESEDEDESNDESENEDESEDESEEDSEDESEDDESEEEVNTATEVTIKADELNSLKAKIAEYEQKEAVLATEKFVDSMVASSENSKGRFLPKQRESLVAFATTLNSEQRTMFASFVKTMPKLMYTEEMGTSASETKTASEQVTVILDKFTKEGLSEMQAQEKLQKDHADIYNEYQLELNK